MALTMSLVAALPVPGRSVAASQHGVAAVSQPLAAQAAAQILQRGGNAVDAAIAANAAQGLMEPTSNGIGGDLFAMVYLAKEDKLYGINASVWSPAGMTVELLKSKGIEGELPYRGVYTVTVPGAVAGWAALHQRFGRLPLATDLAPAIWYAENGFPVMEVTAELWSHSVQMLGEDPESRATFLTGGRSPRAGETFRNPNLARSLRRIAEQGIDGFYRGPTAQAIVDLVRQRGCAGAADRSEEGGLPRRALAASRNHRLAGKRHHLPERGGRRREHRLADSEQLRWFRVRAHARRRRLHAAEPRQPLHPPPRPAQHHRRTQAPAPHHHSGLPAEGRPEDRVRNHGRVEPVPGARAIRGRHRRFRHDPPAGARGGPLHQGHFRRVRRGDRELRAAASPGRARFAGASAPGPAATNAELRLRPGGALRPQDLGEARRQRPAPRRPGDPRAGALFREVMHSARSAAAMGFDDKLKAELARI